MIFLAILCSPTAGDPGTATLVCAGTFKAKERAEGQVLEAYFASIFEMSRLVDTFATWLLAVVGGTAALTIANMKSISSVLPFENIKVGLGFLLISGLFGFPEKFLALNIRTAVAQEAKLKDILRETSARYQARGKSFPGPEGLARFPLHADSFLCTSQRPRPPLFRLCEKTSVLWHPRCR